MGNERWIMARLRDFPHGAGFGVTEIGAGDGDLTARMAKAFPSVSVAAYDLAARPEKLANRVVWHEGDVFTKAAPETGGVLVANLFLHHFEAAALVELGSWLEGFEVLLFNEPDRARLPHFLGSLLHPFINRVTKHDLHVSIDAGFASGEIQELLALDPRHWHVRETSTWRGARRVVASRV